MKKTKKCFLVMIVIWGVSFFGVNAQEVSSPQAVDCFDYYHFGGVELEFRTDKFERTAGEDVLVEVIARNKNAYPVADGAIFVKVYRKSNYSNAHSLSNDLVSSFYLEKDISLPAQGSKKFSGVWKTGKDFANGEYEFKGFFNVKDSYNLSGLPFYDVNYSGSLNMKLKDGEEGMVFFEKDQVSINGQKYSFNTPPPYLDLKNTENAEVSYSLSNKSGEAKEVELTAKLYYWDAVNEKNLLKTEVKIISLRNGESIKDLFKFSIKDYSVYDLQLIAKPKNGLAKSIIEVRTGIRNGAKNARLNFPGFSKFPLKKGEPVDLFTCYHATGDFSVDDGKIVVEALDKNGKVFGSMKYAGVVSGNMSAQKISIIPEEDMRKADIRASYYQGEKLVSQEIISYDCAKIGNCDKEIIPEPVKKIEEPKNSQEPSFNWVTYGLWFLAFAIPIGLILIFLARTVLRRKK